MDCIEALAKAVEIAGSEPKLARMAGVSQPAINLAKKRGRVSAELAARIDRALEGAVSKADLCPEIFGALPGEPS